MQGEEITKVGKKRKEVDEESKQQKRLKKARSENTISDPLILPAELLVHTFQYLNQKDLFMAGLACKTWKELTAENWRANIRQYFPYLRETKKSAYFEDPQTLYHHEYGHYQKLSETWKLSGHIELIMGCLEGKITAVDTNAALNQNQKNKLYMVAAINGHRDAIDKLDNESKTEVIELAAQNGALDTIKYFCSDDNPFHRHLAENVAKKYGNFEVAAYLNPTLSGSLIEKAAAKGDLEGVKKELALMKLSEAAEARSKGRFWAAACGQLKVLKYLFEEEMWFTTSSPKYVGNEFDAIHSAIFNGHCDIVKYLWDKKCLFPQDVLKVAAEHGQYEIVKFIFESGAKKFINVTKAAFHAAVVNNHFDVMCYLIKATRKMFFEEKSLFRTETVRGIPIQDKYQALSVAAQNGHLRQVKYLLNELNFESPFTAFSNAVRCEQFLVVKYFLEEVADISERDIHCAYRMVSDHNQSDTVSLLEQHLKKRSEKSQKNESRCMMM